MMILKTRSTPSPFIFLFLSHRKLPNRPIGIVTIGREADLSREQQNDLAANAFAGLGIIVGREATAIVTH